MALSAEIKALDQELLSLPMCSDLLSAKRDDERMGSADPSSASDINATVEIVQQLRFVPADFPAVPQLAVAAAVPLLAVAITQAPVCDLIKWIVGTLF